MQTPLQQLIQWIDESRVEIILNTDLVKQKAESLLPVEKEFARNTWETGHGAGYSDSIDDLHECKRSSPDFPTYWKQIDNDKTESK